MFLKIFPNPFDDGVIKGRDYGPLIGALYVIIGLLSVIIIIAFKNIYLLLLIVGLIFAYGLWPRKVDWEDE